MIDSWKRAPHEYDYIGAPERRQRVVWTPAKREHRWQCHKMQRFVCRTPRELLDPEQPGCIPSILVFLSALAVQIKLGSAEVARNRLRE